MKSLIIVTRMRDSFTGSNEDAFLTKNGKRWSFHCCNFTNQSQTSLELADSIEEIQNLRETFLTASEFKFVLVDGLALSRMNKKQADDFFNLLLPNEDYVLKAVLALHPGAIPSPAIHSYRLDLIKKRGGIRWNFSEITQTSKIFYNNSFYVYSNADAGAGHDSASNADLELQKSVLEVRRTYANWRPEMPPAVQDDLYVKIDQCWKLLSKQPPYC